MPKYSRNDVLKYYEVLGVSEREGLFVPEEGKTVKLESLSELFDINNLGDCGNWLDNPDACMDPQVISSMKDLSDAYSTLHFCVFDGFMYESKSQKEKAFEAAMAVYDDLKDINVEVENDETKSTVRRNDLRATILRGLCCAGDLNTFRMYQQNCCFNTVYFKVSDIEADEARCEKKGIEYDLTPEPLMKLYYLMAYASFMENGSGFEMFDFRDRVQLGKLRSVVRRNLSEGVPFKDDANNRGRVIGKVMRMSHFTEKVCAHHDETL